MLIVDSANLPRLEAGLKRETYQDKVQRWVDDQLAHTVFIKEFDLSVANVDRQYGQSMSTYDFEVKLHRLDPDFIFERNEKIPSKKGLYLPRRGEKGLEKHYICAYENTVKMPEHSIRAVKEELVRDPSVWHLDRKDLPKHEFVPGQGYKFEDEVLPGWQKVQIPWREYLRGWRTVLVRIVEQGIKTPTQVEAIFGRDDRPEWANHMGHRTLKMPW